MHAVRSTMSRTGTLGAVLALALAFSLISPGTAYAGFGGQTLFSTPQGSGSVAVITTCLNTGTLGGCDGAVHPNTVTWYTKSRANCTHTYPSNDYFKNDVPGFNTVVHLSSLNCNVVVAYLNGTQGGGGAVSKVVLAGNDVRFTGTRFSVSLHF
jgi:hypothetical protein